MRWLVLLLGIAVAIANVCAYAIFHFAISIVFAVLALLFGLAFTIVS